MRAFPVPVQLESEERVIGGYLTLRQLIYLLAGFALGGGIAIITHFFPLTLRILLCVLFFLIGSSLAFMRVYSTDLDIFLYRWFKWRFNKREFYLKGDE